MSGISNTNVSYQKEKLRTSEDGTHQEQKRLLFAQLLWDRTLNPHRGHLLSRGSRVPTFDELVVWQVPSAPGKTPPPESFAVLWAIALDTGVLGGWAQVSWAIAGDCSRVLEHLHSHMLWPAASLRGFPWATPLRIWSYLEVTYPGDGLTQHFPLNPGLLWLQNGRVPLTFSPRCSQVLIFTSFCY